MVKSVKLLAEEYIHSGIIRPSKPLDVFHLSLATIYKIDYLVSWNYKDIVGSTRRKAILEFNIKNKLYIPVITTPQNFLITQ